MVAGLITDPANPFLAKKNSPVDTVPGVAGVDHVAHGGVGPTWPWLANSDPDNLEKDETQVRIEVFLFTQKPYVICVETKPSGFCSVF
jgi:hypothetical protein